MGYSPAATKAASKLAWDAILNRRPRRCFQSDFETAPDGTTLLDWTLSNTNSGSETMASKVAALGGGNTITFVDPDGTSLCRIDSKQFLIPTSRPSWTLAVGVTVANSAQFQTNVQDGSQTISAVQIIGGANPVRYWNPNTSTYTNSAKATAANGFDWTRKCTIGMWWNPLTAEIRYYIFYEVGGTTHHVFLGTVTWSSPTITANRTIRQTSSTSPTGNSTCDRVRVGEVTGVVTGCSTDGCHNVFDPSPSLYGNSNYLTGNSADNLAERLWGDRYGIIPMAHGGWNFDNLLNGTSADEADATIANMVIALLPVTGGLVVHGSAINDLSIAAVEAVQATRDADVAAAKVRYLSAIDLALAAHAKVVCRTVAPAGGSTNYTTAANKQLITDWNAWMHATLPGYSPGNIAISDVWAALKDPNDATVLAAAYDIGDHLHFTLAGAEQVAIADAQAVLAQAS